MFQDSTNQFSFILKPSEHGIGVFATRDIKAGEEILIDYNTLGEPESVKEEYY